MASRMSKDAACAILGVQIDVEEDTLRRAWRTLALKSHPDKNPGDAQAAGRFREVCDAYKTLSSGDVEIKSYEELCAEMDDVRCALLRAQEIAAGHHPAAGDTDSCAQRGKMLKIGGASWVGDISNGRPHGIGDLVLPNGSVHHGSFDNGLAEGGGVLMDASGSVFRGAWVANKRNGQFETTDPKGGTWHDVYDAEGKRVSRKKGAPVPTGAQGAVRCRACRVRFHSSANSLCMRHSGKWLEAPTHNADGSAATVDKVAFPEGGMWLCCGSKSKTGERGCTLASAHEAELPPPPQPIDRCIQGGDDPAPAAAVKIIPSFIESSFTTKAEYKAWRQSQ
jgi:hypothetical protein